MDQPRPRATAQLETTWAATLLLAALLLTSRQLPWALLAAVPALGALILAVRATWLRVKARERGLAVWSGVGVLFAGYVLLGVAVQGILYGPVDEYRRCSDAANTQIAENRCTATFRDRIGWAGASFLDG